MASPAALAALARVQAMVAAAAAAGVPLVPPVPGVPPPPKAAPAEEEGTAVAEEVNEIFADYSSSLSIGLPHPTAVVESGLLATVSLPPITYPHDGVPSDAIRDGKLSSLQLETILLAGQRHLLLQDGVRAGFFLGDGTGVGKGRQIAGIILDNICRGRKKHVWVTTSADLRQEAENDFKDIGAASVLVRDMSQLDETMRKPMGMSADFKDPPAGLVLLISYSMLSGSKVTIQGHSMSRLQQLLEWLGGESFEGCLIFDEAHKAKGFHLGDNSDKTSTKQSLAVREIQAKLPRARVVYASATGIESLDHMGYATRMGLWGNPSFKDFEAFHASFSKRGVGALELLAVEMKISSSFVSRSLSWKDAEFEMVDIDLTPEQSALYTTCSKLFFDLRRALATAISRTGLDGHQSPMKLFWAVQQRFFRDLINSFKVDFIVQETERVLAEGQCMVIGLQSTGEAGLHQALEEDLAAGTATHDCRGKHLLAELVSSSKQSVLTFLHKHFPTVTKPVEEPLPQSEEELHGIAAIYQARGLAYDLQAALAQRQEALRRRAAGPTPGALVQELLELKQGLEQRVKDLHVPPAPLDSLIDKLGGPTRVAEMTGRRARLVRHATGGSFVVDVREQQASKGGTNLAGDGCESVNIKERKDFMDGKKLVAIISDAASTGISLHASIAGAKNQRRRVHCTLELSWSADKTLQQLGRTHRSHQSSSPIYKLLMTNLGGEKRFASGVAKRLLSLGALTRGDRRAATVIDFSSLNFDSRSGAKALRRLLSYKESLPEELLSAAIAELGPVPGIDLSDGEQVSAKVCELLELLDLDGSGDKSPPVRRLLNRLLMLPEAEQNLLFSLFSASLDQVIRSERQQGRYDEGTTTLRASSIRLVGEPELVWQDEAGSGQAKLQAYRIETDRGVPFQDARQEYERTVQEDPEAEQAGAGFYLMRSELFGRPLVLLAVPKATAPHVAIITRPNTGKQQTEMAFHELREKYRRLSSPEQAEAAWTSIFDHTRDHCTHFHGCKVRGCRNGSRMQQLFLVSGAVVPIWAALEKTVSQFHSILTVPEAQLRVVCVNLDDGRRLVGVKLPMYEEILRTLRAEVRALAAEHAGGRSVIEPVLPVDTNLLRRATTAKRTMLSFFGKKADTQQPDSKKAKLTPAPATTTSTTASAAKAGLTSSNSSSRGPSSVAAPGQQLIDLSADDSQ